MEQFHKLAFDSEDLLSTKARWKPECLPNSESESRLCKPKKAHITLEFCRF